jgi:hypothetical protein
LGLRFTNNFSFCSSEEGDEDDEDAELEDEELEEEEDVEVEGFARYFSLTRGKYQSSV